MTDITAGSMYQRDYYAWTKAQAAALRRLAEQRSKPGARLREPGGGGGELGAQ